METGSGRLRRRLWWQRSAWEVKTKWDTANCAVENNHPLHDVPSSPFKTPGGKKMLAINVMWNKKKGDWR